MEFAQFFSLGPSKMVARFGSIGIQPYIGSNQHINLCKYFDIFIRKMLQVVQIVLVYDPSVMSKPTRFVGSMLRIFDVTAVNVNTKIQKAIWKLLPYFFLFARASLHAVAVRISCEVHWLGNVNISHSPLFPPPPPKKKLFSFYIPSALFYALFFPFIDAFDSLIFTRCSVSTFIIRVLFFSPFKRALAKKKRNWIIFNVIFSFSKQFTCLHQRK